MAHVLSVAPYAPGNSNLKRRTDLYVEVSYSSGVPSIVTANSANGFTITGSAGAYSGTCPVGPRGFLFAQQVDPDPIGTFVIVQAFDPKAGTFSYETHSGDLTDAAEAPGDDERTWLHFVVEGG